MTEQVFVRKASGLVRDLNAWDCFIANTCMSGPIGLAVAYGVYWALYALPGGDFLTAVAIGTFLCIWHVTTYALFSAVYPRAGGDYLFLSRSLHPAIGFMASINFLFFEVIYFGLVLYWFGQITVYAPLAVLGFSLNDPMYLTAASWVASPTGIFILGTLLVIVLGLMTTVGTKFMFRINDVLFILAILGMVVGLAGLALSSRADFIARFNLSMNQYTGSPDSYQWFIDTAKSFGLSVPSHYVPAMTVGMIAVGTSSTCWGFFSSFWAGEVKNASSVKRQLGLMIGPTILNGLLLILAMYVLFNTVGYEFLTSVFYVYGYNWGASYPLPVPPYTNFLMAILYGNPAVQFFVAVTFMFWPFVIMIPAMMLSTRYIFSWSFDRLTPSILARVNPKYHTPVYATLVTCILYELVLLIVALRQDLIWPVLSASSMYIWVGNVALVGITAVIFPWRKKDVYQASPIKNLKIGPLPLISVTGFITVLVCIFNAYLYLTYPTLGLGPPETALYIFASAAIIGLAMYYIAVQYRKSHGIPVELAFKEIPPA